MKINILLFLIMLLALPVVAFGYGEDGIDCSTCHYCKEPTGTNTCLKPCPTLHRPEAMSAHKLNEAPDTFLIDEISELYQPVNFNHKLHADMAQMGGDCETCHHYTPKDHIPPCSECHGGEKNPNNLRQPSLKGAYHRQCLSCHREWSHDTKCIICHLPTEGTLVDPGNIDTTDILGIAHPKLVVPVKKVYNTPYEKGPIVTLHHQEHIDLFGLRCVDCHKSENCSYCHDMDIEAKPKKTQEQVHAICNDCHKKDACSNCHANKEMPGFSHASESGWKLSKYHKDLECRNCHPTGKQITTMNGSCANCHAGWNFENFRHEVVGLRIDEIHMEFDCEDCHAKQNYHKKPTCDNCHDDGRTAEDALPGEKVN